MAKVLLIEDDARLSTSLAKWLSAEGHIVESVGDGADAAQMLDNFSFDVIVLDWSLPGLTGIEVLKRYRANGGAAPVIFLTGQGDLNSKKTGLDSGADDYLTKPFEAEELSARIRSLLRRPSGLLPVLLTAGNVTLEPGAKSVTVDGAPVRLGRKEFAILEFLMRHPNECFSAESLMQQVWPSDTDSSQDAVRSCMRVLRQKLATQNNAGIISTVPGIGYTIRQDTD